MAELNFGLLNPPGSQSIGNAFVTGMDQGQEARARDLQMQQSTRKGQMDELAYRKALDTESRLNKYYANIAANGGPKTALEAENAMINSGIPHIADMGAKAQLLRLTNESDLALFNAANPKPGAPAAAATAVAPMAPAVVPEPGSFGADVAERKAANPFAPAPDTRTNMMDGAAPATATVNKLPAAVSGAARPNISEEVAAIDDQIARNIQLGTPRAKAQAEWLREKRAALIKTTATGGSLFDSRGEVIATAKSEFETLLANSGLSAPEQTAARQARVEKESTTSYEFLTALAQLGKTTDPTTRAFLKGRLVQLSTHAPGTTVNVDTKVGNKYGETFAKDIGEADAKLRLAALDAPTMAANANQTLKLLEDPKIFTGGAANVKLNIARALNVLGDTDTTSIANTESLVQSTGNATLAAIKGSGLGTGQGFTDKDLKMLQGVAGGTIELNADTLRAFANAQHNAATAMVKKWKSRRANIPTAALSGTGIDKETYSVEPKFSAYVEVKTTADGRKLGKKADGTVEVIK